jgi:hypothetical protein
MHLRNERAFSDEGLNGNVPPWDRRNLRSKNISTVGTRGSVVEDILMELISVPRNKICDSAQSIV